MTVCDEDTTANGPAMGGLSRCVLKGNRTVFRGVRGSDAPRLLDFIKPIQSKKRKNNLVELNQKVRTVRAFLSNNWVQFIL